MVMSDGGVFICTNRIRNEGTAITTRMTTGITVQATSIRVLWVVRDGVGLARALNFTITMTSRASTNIVIAVLYIITAITIFVLALLVIVIVKFNARANP